MAVAAPSEEAPKREQIRYTDTCRGCGKQVKRHSRKGLTWRCPHCKRTNPGPGLLADLAKPPEPGTRRRLARREADAEKRAAEVPAAPAAAPVRRKRAAPAAASADPQPGSEAKGAGGAPRSRPAVGAPAAKPARRSLLDRLIWGDDE